MADQADVWRIYTLPDGTSSMECIKVELTGGRSSLFAGTGVQIVSMAPNGLVDWHVAPRRQMIGTIAGEGEIETGDGKKLTLRPGVLTLVEDLTGQGHITRTGPQERISLFMPLAADTKVG
jgi:hypothetical protein